MDKEKYNEGIKRVNSIYIHYREQAGNTVSTVVIISATLIGILVNIAKPELSGVLKGIFYIFGMFPIFLSIFLGIQAKYLYFLGYREFARSEYEYFEVDYAVTSEGSAQRQKMGKSLFDKSNDYFETADKHTNRCRWAFFIGLFAIFIIYSLHFFNISKIINIICC